MAIAQGWSDAQLLVIEKGVAAYFNRQPRQPNFDEGKALISEVQRLQGAIQQTAEQYQEQQEFVEFLGPARSLRHPFGAPPKEVEVAQSQLEKIRQRWMSLKQNLKETERQFEAWRQPAALYREWRFGDTGEKMHECQKILQLDSVQERIIGIHEAQERQEMLEKLQQWEVIAQKLGWPKNYLAQIQNITEQYCRGIPLSDITRQALENDFKTYRFKQKELKQQSAEFSL